LARLLRNGRPTNSASPHRPLVGYPPAALRLGINERRQSHSQRHAVTPRVFGSQLGVAGGRGTVPKTQRFARPGTLVTRTNHWADQGLGSDQGGRTRSSPNWERRRARAAARCNAAEDATSIETTAMFSVNRNARSIMASLEPRFRDAGLLPTIPKRYFQVVKTQ
jgi:hypothetical protein